MPKEQGKECRPVQTVQVPAGEEVAKQIQLQMEYGPAPPFSAGSPSSAGAIVTAQVMAKIEAFQARRREVTLGAAAALE